MTLLGSLTKYYCFAGTIYFPFLFVGWGYLKWLMNIALLRLDIVIKDSFAPWFLPRKISRLNMSMSCLAFSAVRRQTLKTDR